MHKYNSTMDLGDSTMSQAVSAEKCYVEFFHNIKICLRRWDNNNKSRQHIGSAEHYLLQKLEAAKGSVRASLLDDFDTPAALFHLGELVRDTHRYLDLCCTNNNNNNSNNSNGEGGGSSAVVRSVGRYVTWVFRCFGLTNEGVDIGFPLGTSSEVDKEVLLSPFLDALAKFRENVRAAAIGGLNEEVLRETDRLRDEVMPDLGVRMEDKASTTVWKLDDEEVLRREKLQKISDKLAKDQQREEAARKLREREEKAKIPPEELFRSDPTFSGYTFDGSGLPSLDRDGQPMSKSILKKLQKELQKQKEVHDKFMSKRIEEEEINY